MGSISITLILRKVFVPPAVYTVALVRLAVSTTSHRSRLSPVWMLTFHKKAPTPNLLRPPQSHAPKFTISQIYFNALFVASRSLPENETVGTAHTRGCGIGGSRLFEIGWCNRGGSAFGVVWCWNCTFILLGFLVMSHWSGEASTKHKASQQKFAVSKSELNLQARLVPSHHHEQCYSHTANCTAN